MARATSIRGRELMGFHPLDGDDVEHAHRCPKRATRADGGALLSAEDQIDLAGDDAVENHATDEHRRRR